jgi:hypothetical protein
MQGVGAGGAPSVGAGVDDDIVQPHGSAAIVRHCWVLFSVASPADMNADRKHAAMPFPLFSQSRAAAIVPLHLQLDAHAASCEEHAFFAQAQHAPKVISDGS